MQFPRRVLRRNLTRIVGDELMQETMVLSDDLYKLWSEFKKGIKINDNNKLEALLSYLRMPFLTNIAQLDSLQIKEPNLRTALLQKSPQLQKLGLEKLCQHTLLKIILTTENTNYPYCSILPPTNNLINTFTITCSKNESRNKAIDFLKQHLKVAKSLYINDSYFAEQWQISKQLLELISPNNISIFLPEWLFTEKISNSSLTLPVAIKRSFSNCNVKIDVSNKDLNDKMHDRYIIIDNELEIIFSSGIDNFFEYTQNESTLVIRRKI